uniref:Uncharacterized protein n=1 Tax=Xiphophorus couchianus TaxID=32473 RepID=A0A3B5LPN1_9TELE
MGCTSAKQVSAVPNDEEGRGKAYSNGDLYSGQFYSWLSRRCPQLRLTPQLSLAHVLLFSPRRFLRSSLF